MDFDNERDRHKYGYDAGQIVDGVVTIDPETQHFVLVDDDGIGFDLQEALKSLEGQKIRLTMISVKSIEEMQHLLAQANGPAF